MAGTPFANKKTQISTTATMDMHAAMKNTIFFAVSAALFAACLVLDILGVVRCRKRGEEIGNRLMLECILHTMQVILSVALLTY